MATNFGDTTLGAKWHRLGIKLIQGYGATEASPTITCHALSDPRYDSAGRPLPGVEVRISDEGEVLVRGPNITPGYWEAPEQTAAAFDGDWYKTGDIGFFDREGFLHLKGRKKDMIVLPSGQNVYPEDIEGVLSKHPAVSDAVVVGLPRGSDIQPHAALILNDDTPAAAVIAWANAQLAEQQQVRGYTVWPEEDFPRTHTLKVKKPVVLEVLKGAAPPPPPTASRPSSAGQRREVPDLVAEIGGLTAEDVRAGHALGADLNLDSLKRVELLSTIEEETGVYLDESQVGPETTVDQLAELVRQGSASGAAPSFPRWGMRWWCRILRGFLQRAAVFPVATLAYRTRVTGTKHLDGLNGPVLFAANHNLHLDNPLFIKAMPRRWRRRLAIAAAAEMWRSPLWSIGAPLFGNGFPFSRDSAVRPSLENLGRILDDGWSVLLYPEGRMTHGGPMQPFKSGVGLIAVECGLPVVPIRLKVDDPGAPDWHPVWRRGRVEVRFGEPLTFPPGTSYPEAAQAIEAAVRAL